MAILELIANGITLIGAARDLHGWVTGYSLARKIDEINHRVEQIDGKVWDIKRNLTRYGNFVFHHDQNEIIGSKNSAGIIKENKKLLVPEINLLVPKNKSSIVLSNFLQLPENFLKSFKDNPDQFLFFNFKLGARDLPPNNILHDKTLVPVHYNINGEEYVGFIKVGYLKSYLGFEYQSIIHSQKSAHIFKNPYTGAPMKRLEPCFCGSGKRYKFCHG
ncbi:SEC-C domain-containing protein [Belnapia moabensis]|uniref:SEC-C domain-containing protein n=1 Tax=Belnapia moabensis TaxID=365533 RepID=UPI000A03AEA3|nr:SEC-C domain-containing protein [Belnapia moabensis]